MKKQNGVLEKLVLVSQVGLAMLTSIFLCLAVGYVIDKIFHTSLLIFFIVLGVLSGYKAAYTILKRYIKEPPERDDNDKEWVKKAFSETQQDKKR